MLTLVCYPPARKRLTADLPSAHVYGADGVPLRAEISLSGDTIRADTRTSGPIGLSLLWPVKDFGVIQLETTRLPPSEAPYHLHVELARHRLMRISLKREEWGLFDYPGMEDIAEQIDVARDLFISSLEQINDPIEAARLADDSLSLSMWASERMCRFHADVFLKRRLQAGGFARGFLGAAVPAGPAKAAAVKKLAELFDFVRVPLAWRDVQPKEQDTRFEACDEWVKLCAAAKVGLRGGPLLNFGVRSVPDWMYIWENDFDTILEYAREHVQRTVKRYADRMSGWVVASGLHADSVFSFNFEQIIEITRMAATVTKQLAPRSQVVIDLTQPFGEYYARNQRTIPPLMYADMIVQSGIQFDAFGLQFIFGISSEGYQLRDLLQISALIDKIANLGKPLHVTALGVPSVAVNGAEGGEWHGPWSDEAQAKWMVAFSEVALSKPYVESICVDALIDVAGSGIPSSGVLRENLAPKPASTQLGELRKRLQSEPAK